MWWQTPSDTHQCSVLEWVPIDDATLWHHCNALGFGVRAMILSRRMPIKQIYLIYWLGLVCWGVGRVDNLQGWWRWLNLAPSRRSLQPQPRHTSDSIKVKCQLKWKIQQSVSQSFHAIQPNLTQFEMESPKTRYSAIRSR